MASRSLCRRLIQASRRLHVNNFAHLSRCAQSLPQVQLSPDLTSIPRSYSQIRTLCSKSGEGIIINIQNEDDFETRVMDSPVPVIVDFHASWCGPCKMLGPRLESLVAAKKGKVILAKVDVDEVFDVAQKHSVMSVPTVIAVRQKTITDKFVGLQDDDVIETMIDKLIG